MFRFIYHVKDDVNSPVYQEKQRRFEEIQRELSNQRLQEENKRLQKIADKKRIADEMIEAEYQKRENIKKLEAEKSQSQINALPESATEGGSPNPADSPQQAY